MTCEIEVRLSSPPALQLYSTAPLWTVRTGAHRFWVFGKRGIVVTFHKMLIILDLQAYNLKMENKKGFWSSRLSNKLFVDLTVSSCYARLRRSPDSSCVKEEVVVLFLLYSVLQRWLFMGPIFPLPSIWEKQFEVVTFFFVLLGLNFNEPCRENGLFQLKRIRYS